MSRACGISCFLVPKDATVTVDKKEDKMGLRASNTATITFDDTEVPEANLLGEENRGFKHGTPPCCSTRASATRSSEPVAA